MHAFARTHHQSVTHTQTGPYNSYVNERSRRYIRWGQTEPPTVPTQVLFKGRSYPVGEIVPYPQEDQQFRVTDAEKRVADKLGEDMYV